MKKNNFWYFENLDLSNYFCPRKLGGYREINQDKKYKKGEYIYLPEESSNKLFLITEGQVKIGSFNDSNKEITKSILSPGEVFGELALVGEEKRRDYAQALKDTSLCIIKEEDFGSLMKEHSALNGFLMRILGSRVLKIEKRLESMVFKDSRSRIVEYLIDLVADRGSRVGYEWVVRNFITHQEIANLTATSRQTVTTVLNDLRNNNLIKFDRRRLLIRDLEGLKKEIFDI